MKIGADFSKTTGTIKPMHGVGQPPFLGSDFSLFHYLKEAGIPYSRLHDVGGALGCGLYVDIPNLFRDFNANAYDPASYDFAFTDRLIANLMEQDCEPFFRLGVTIENSHMLKAYHIFPPADFQKWAVICEHVIRHYNEGWADGYHYNIKYWEIWNEPDSCYTNETSAMWKGTPEEYYQLYGAASKHLKKTFGESIKIGGYAHCGFMAYANYPDLGDIGRKAEYFEEFFFEFMDGFLKYIKANNCPIDYFSWHTYADAETAMTLADVCHTILEKYGYGGLPDILNEWNTTADVKLRSGSLAAARAYAMMLGMQKKTTSLLCFYDARLGPSSYGGMFNPDSFEPYLTYYAFKSFNEAYKLKNEAESACDSKNVYTLAAAGDGKAVLLIANLNDDDCDCTLELNGVELTNATVLVIDDGHTYVEKPQAISGNTLHLTKHSCTEVRFNTTRG